MIGPESYNVHGYVFKGNKPTDGRGDNLDLNIPPEPPVAPPPDSEPETPPATGGSEILGEENKMLIVKSASTPTPPPPTTNGGSRSAGDNNGYTTETYTNEDGAVTVTTKDSSGRVIKEVTTQLDGDIYTYEFEYNSDDKMTKQISSYNGNIRDTVIIDYDNNTKTIVDTSRSKHTNVTVYNNTTGFVNCSILYTHPVSEYSDGNCRFIVTTENGKRAIYDMKVKLEDVSLTFDKNGNVTGVVVKNDYSRIVYTPAGHVKEVEDYAENTVTYFDGNCVSGRYYKDFGAIINYSDEESDGDLTVTSDTLNIEDVYKNILDHIFGKLLSNSELDSAIFDILNYTNVEDFLAYYKKNNPNGEDLLTLLQKTYPIAADKLINHLEVMKNISNKINLHKEGKTSPSNTPETPENGNTVGENGGTKPSDGTTGEAGDGDGVGGTGNSSVNDNKPIDGGELPEVTVIGEAGEGVIMHDGYAFKLITNADGTVCYQVCSPEGDFYYVSTEDYAAFVKNSKLYDVEDFLKEKGVTDSLDIPDDPELYNWTEQEKNGVISALKDTFGEEYFYSVVYNVDGTFSYVVLNKDGKVLYNPEDDKPQTLLDLANISDPTKLLTYQWTEQEKNDILASLKLKYGFNYEYGIVFNFDGTISFVVFDKNGNEVIKEEYVSPLEEVGDEELEGYNWTDKEKREIERTLRTIYGSGFQYSIVYNFDGSYSFAILDVNGNKVDEETLAKLSYQWMRRTFVDPYGNFNGRSFNEWVNDTFGKGNGYYYEGDDTNIVWNAMNKAYSTNDWDSFWDYLEHACSSGTRGSGGGGGCRKTAIGIDIYGNEYVEGGTPSTGYESLDRLLRLRDQTSAYFGRDVC